MKIQDIIFLIVLLFITYKQIPKLSVATGLICFLAAIPLFSAWIFFTAERLTWYGSVFILLAIIQIIIKKE